MWTCPKCKREFKNQNQDHTCGFFTIDEVFGKYPELKDMFNHVKQLVTGFGDIKVTPVKNAVMFSVQTNFLVVKPHRNYLIIEFTSTKCHNEFPVEKCIKITKTRYFHLVKIDSIENIDVQLQKWLKEAWESDLPNTKKYEL